MDPSLPADAVVGDEVPHNNHREASVAAAGGSSDSVAVPMPPPGMPIAMDDESMGPPFSAYDVEEIDPTDGETAPTPSTSEVPVPPEDMPVASGAPNAVEHPGAAAAAPSAPEVQAYKAHLEQKIAELRWEFGK